MLIEFVALRSEIDNRVAGAEAEVRSLTSVSPCHDDFQLTPVNGHLERRSACLERSNNGKASSDLRLQLVSAVHLLPQSVRRWLMRDDSTQMNR
jgi:hypothetical protein